MSQILFKYDKLFIKEMVLFCTHDQIEQNIKLMILNCKKKQQEMQMCSQEGDLHPSLNYSSAERNKTFHCEIY